MNISDLLDPQKMKEFEDGFKPVSQEDIDEARKRLTELGERPRMAYVKSTKNQRSAIFKRSSFGKSNSL